MRTHQSYQMRCVIVCDCCCSIFWIVHTSNPTPNSCSQAMGHNTHPTTRVWGAHRTHTHTHPVHTIIINECIMYFICSETAMCAFSIRTNWSDGWMADWLKCMALYVKHSGSSFGKWNTEISRKIDYIGNFVLSFLFVSSSLFHRFVCVVHLMDTNWRDVLTSRTSLEGNEKFFTVFPDYFISTQYCGMLHSQQQQWRRVYTRINKIHNGFAVRRLGGKINAIARMRECRFFSLWLSASWYTLFNIE